MTSRKAALLLHGHGRTGLSMGLLAARLEAELTAVMGEEHVASSLRAHDRLGIDSVEITSMVGMSTVPP